MLLNGYEVLAVAKGIGSSDSRCLIPQSSLGSILWCSGPVAAEEFPTSSMPDSGCDLSVTPSVVLNLGSAMDHESWGAYYRLLWGKDGGLTAEVWGPQQISIDFTNGAAESQKGLAEISLWQ